MTIISKTVNLGPNSRLPARCGVGCAGWHCTKHGDCQAVLGAGTQGQGSSGTESQRKVPPRGRCGSKRENLITSKVRCNLYPEDDLGNANTTTHIHRNGPRYVSTEPPLSLRAVSEADSIAQEKDAQSALPLEDPCEGTLPRE